MSDNEATEFWRPEWFGDTAVRWGPALRSEDFAARVEPLGIDAQQRLHVLCESPAWHTQLRLVGKAALARINEIVPEARLTGAGSTKEGLPGPPIAGGRRMLRSPPGRGQPKFRR